MDRSADIVRIEPFLADRAPARFRNGVCDVHPEMTLEESVALLERMVAAALPPPEAPAASRARWAGGTR